MRVLRQVALVFAVCVLCEGVSALLPVPFPGSVLAMLVMLLLFVSKRLKLSDIQETSDLLLGNMTLVFIPPFISVMNYLELLGSIAVQFCIIVVVSTLLTFLAGSLVVTLVFRLQGRFAAGTGGKRHG